ncbi:MAG: flavin monoamine oxidase family protein [Solirubrobacteraceae bacterium]
MRHDVVVLGAGLAGLSAARDLMRGDADVVVLEARARAGGRVQQTTTPDGRLVQLGGEVVAPFHTAYCELVAELGLTLVPSFPDLPGEDTWVLADRTVVGEWLPDADRASYEHAEREFQRLTRTVDPDDPWSHPEAERLDRTSVGTWLRSVGATPNVIRARELAMLALGAESVQRTSLLADLRKEAAAGAHGFYDYDVWECQRVAEGSATVPERLAAELGPRVRCASPVVSVSVGPGGGAAHRCVTVTAQGERFESEAVVCALPAGPLRNVAIDGVSPQRLASLHRARHAVAAKAVFVYADSFWERQGQNGAAYFETQLLGGTWVQREGIISALVPPERLAPLLAGAPEHRQQELLEEMADAFGPQALAPQAVHLRNWGVDPWTLGYITAWRPGDVMAVGPLQGTHAPPFYVCGSDQWVCGYMEGAVRTGRAAARAALEAP